MVAYLQRRHYAPNGRPLRACHPRDLLDQVTALCRYRGQEPVITRELLDAACRAYFVDNNESGVMWRAELSRRRRPVASSFTDAAERAHRRTAARTRRARDDERRASPQAARPRRHDGRSALVITQCDASTRRHAFAIDVVFVDAKGMVLKIVEDLGLWRMAGVFFAVHRHRVSHARAASTADVTAASAIRVYLNAEHGRTHAPGRVNSKAYA